jgi:hypothetical protein
VRSVSRCYKQEKHLGRSFSQMKSEVDICWNLVLICYGKELAAEAGNISKFQRKSKSAFGSRYQGTTTEGCKRLMRHIVPFSCV